MSQRVTDRLSVSWPKRAGVKRAELDLEPDFSALLPDFPERLLPFREHPSYESLAPELKQNVLSLFWIAFNKSVIDIEQTIVNPGFAGLLDGELGAALSEAQVIAVAQALVDEQYHSLIHLRAVQITSRRRQLFQAARQLPLAHKARRRAECVARAESVEARADISLAFMTVAELSINAYLDLTAKDTSIQPANSALARLHSRDESCHAPIAAELAREIFPRFSPNRQQIFIDGLGEAMKAFMASDWATNRCVLELANVPRVESIVGDAAGSPPQRAPLKDFRAIRRLCVELDVIPRLDFDWSQVTYEESQPSLYSV